MADRCPFDFIIVRKNADPLLDIIEMIVIHAWAETVLSVKVLGNGNIFDQYANYYKN